MPVTERAPNRLVLKSGSTTLALDKGSGRAVLQRKIVIWRPKPAEEPLADITKVTTDMAVDRASGVESGIRCWSSVPEQAGRSRLLINKKHMTT